MKASYNDHLVGPSTLIPEWADWLLSVVGLLLILWPWCRQLWRWAWGYWRVRRAWRSAPAAMRLDSWESRWPDGDKP